MSNAPGDVLAWDSEFFGVRIGRIRGARLSDERARQIEAWAASERIVCVYFLADAADAETRAAAERHGYSLTDIRVRLDAPVGAERTSSGEGTVRLAQPSDLPALKAIARASHTNTRFYADGRFDRSRCAALYEHWIARSLSGELADAVWVADADGTPVGYLTIQAMAADSARIGLVAVDSERRSRGLGSALMAAAHEWCLARGITRLDVIAQGTNDAALRFYGRAGFVVRDVGLWYHRWFDRAEPIPSGSTGEDS